MSKTCLQLEGTLIIVQSIKSRQLQNTRT